jgi:alpha-L-fucosidase
MKKITFTSLWLAAFSTFFLVGTIGLAADPNGGLTVENTPSAPITGQGPDMTWWREAKFGLFIHFGVYAVPAQGEWYMNLHKVPVAKYKEYAKQFNPTKYDPEAWVEMAKNAGMKYIVITAKHHDGFAMFDTKASDWNIVQATPYGKDILKPLAEACRTNGLKLGFYYSQAQDWTNGGSAINGKWDTAQQRDMDDYIDKVSIPQIKELLTNYGPDVPAVLWWDTPMDINAARGKRILDVVEQLRPQTIQNNRLAYRISGNFQTPEQFAPIVGIKGDWETCMTLNHNWGYNRNDHDWKSPTALIHKLADICGKGGNFLLNVGPTELGEIPQPSIDCLKVVGQWMKANGDSIYGTTRGPFPYLSWGAATRKGDLLYLHVFNWPKDGILRVPLLSDAKSAWLLSAPDAKLDVARGTDDLTIKVPATAPDPSDSVVVLQMDGEPQVAPLPTVGATATASASQPNNGPENVLNYANGNRWMAPADVKSASLEIDLAQAPAIAGYGFDEPDVWPRMKQRFTLEVLVGDSWQKVGEGTTEGHGSIGSFPVVTASKFRLTMNCDKGAPAVAKVQLYRPE